MGICSFKEHKIANHIQKQKSNESEAMFQSKMSLKFKKEKMKRIAFPHQQNNQENRENFQIKYNPLKITDINFIIESLKNSYVFYGLKDSEFEEIISNMFYGEIQENEYLFKQNDSGQSFFLVERGRMQVEINEKPIKELKRGDCFGELALLYNAPRSGSIKALEKSYVFGIDGMSFKKVLQEINTKEKNENLYFLERIDFLKDLESYQKELIANYTITQKFSPGQAIVNKGDKADCFYFIKKGVVSCYDGNTFIRDLKDEQSFGEQALFKDGIRTLTVIAKEETKCLAISRVRLQEILGDNIQNVFNKNMLQWTISNHKLFCKLEEIQKLRWINNVKFQKVHNEKDEIMVEEIGNCLTNLYVIIEGYLQYGFKMYEKGEILGIDFVFPYYDINKTLEHNIITRNCTFAYIEVEKLFQIFGVVNFNLEHLFLKNQNDSIIRRKQGLKKKSTICRILKLENLLPIKIYSQTQNTIICTVVDIFSKRKFLLKSFSRSFFKDNEQKRLLEREIDLIQNLNFPFCVKLYKIFQDKRSLYFVYSPAFQIDMFDMVQQIELFDQEETKFYIGSLILALEYFYEKNIIYRDLKPENIVVDENGYIFLHDFGASRKLEENKTRTQSIIGTPHYMAPEIIQGIEYGYLVDLWSLGICMYEFMCGYVPFGEDEDDPYKIYYSVVSQKLRFPDFFNEEENMVTISFIQKLLNRFPEGRMDGSFASIKSHKFFEDFDWTHLLEKNMIPPYLPPPIAEFSPKFISGIIQDGITIGNKAKQIYGKQSFEKQNEKHKWKELYKDLRENQ